VCVVTVEALDQGRLAGGGEWWRECAPLEGSRIGRPVPDNSTVAGKKKISRVDRGRCTKPALNGSPPRPRMPVLPSPDREPAAESRTVGILCGGRSSKSLSYATVK